MHQPELKVFVYGTLKCGYQNHVRYCQGVIRVEEATIIGRLYDMGVGFPALELPTEAILAQGTSDYKADLQTLQKHTVEHESWRPLPEFGPNWGIVHGQVLTFPYPGHQLEGMDRLEGFQPGGWCLYQRVLAMAKWNGQTGPVWVYVMKDLRGKRQILEGKWGVKTSKM